MSGFAAGNPAGPGVRALGLAVVGIIAAALLWCAQAAAAAYTPAGDSVVLEQVPAAAATSKLQPLRERVRTHPDDLQSALALARGYLEIGRANADPRFVSYAQATLAPWLARAHPDPAVLTTQATTLQYLHRFDEALQFLDRALAIQEFNGQAWLTKATVLQVQGHFEAARQACRPLIRISGHLIALACLTGVDSLSGRLAGSYVALNRVFTNDPRLESGLRIWILNELADMAWRSGDFKAAEADLRTALQIDPLDGYSKTGLADLLLSQHRDAEVLQLLRGDEAQDNLLLRLAIAATRLQATTARHWSDMFQARVEAARRDHDFTHLREQARFVLEVRHNATEALPLAENNWRVQREPADLRVYLDAAKAAHDQTALETLRAWIHQTHYEDRTADADFSSATRVAGR